MRFPDFLVIGAMKAGTTSLCRDLESHPSIFFPSVKEPHTLCLDEVLTPEGKQKYAALFGQARSDQVCGEGSTGYSKLPTHQGVVARAKQAVGDELKLVYIVREPVARAVSHHYHMYRGGDAPCDFYEALRSIPAIVDVSRYALQVEPWLEAYGQERVRVVKFEDYVQNRSEVVASVWRFLGVKPCAGAIEEAQVCNAGEEQLVPPRGIRDLVRKVTRSQWYKRAVHPRTPRWVRERIKGGFYQKVPERPGLPSAEAIDYVLDRLRGEPERLAKLIGKPEPFWDMERVRQHYIDAQAAVQ